MRRPTPNARDGDLQSGRGLLAFVFVQIDAALHPAHGLFVEAVGDDVARAQVFLNVKPQDFIENLVRRKRVLVLLVRLQLCARRFFDRRTWDDSLRDLLATHVGIIQRASS